jgi:type II secretory pathway pseudopilin PulG
MKLTRNTKRASGMTLLELTVVILVLLSLISILFVGARAWKKGSDRAANIMVVRNIQQAVRSYQNMNNIAEGAALDMTAAGPIIGPGDFIENTPTHPVAGLSYNYSATVPAIGTLVATSTGTPTNGGAVADYSPTAGTYNDW